MSTSDWRDTCQYNEEEDQTQRDSAGGTARIENTRGKTEVGWTCAEERLWVYWEKDAEDGAAKKMEMKYPLWRSLAGEAERRSVSSASEETSSDMAW